MSLKAFHLFFITISIGMLLMLGALEYRFYRSQGETSDLLLAVASLVAAVLLLFYEVGIYRKFKRLGK